MTMRILLAEDEKDLNHIIAQKLTADGYSVDCCFDGEEAIAVLSYPDYDAVILDIMMPKADGYAVPVSYTHLTLPTKLEV